jgi:hypothetical protein
MAGGCQCGSTLTATANLLWITVRYILQQCLREVLTTTVQHLMLLEVLPTLAPLLCQIQDHVLVALMLPLVREVLRALYGRVRSHGHTAAAVTSLLEAEQACARLQVRV